MANSEPAKTTLLTADEVAAHFRVHVETVRRWTREKRIPSLGDGKARRYELDEVKAALLQPAAPAGEVAS